MNTYIDQLTNFFTMQWLDIFTTILGLIYIYLEYKASIYLWLVGILMPACDVFLYWNHGLYGDAGMAVYYTLAGFYGYAVWKWGSKQNTSNPQRQTISHLPLKYICQWLVLLFLFGQSLITFLLPIPIAVCLL